MGGLGKVKRQNGSITRDAGFFCKSFSKSYREKTISGANLDQSAKADLFDKPMAFQVQVWEVASGKTLEVIANFQKAEKIIESLGLQVEIYQETAGEWKNDYVVSADNWTAFKVVHRYNEKCFGITKCCKTYIFSGSSMKFMRHLMSLIIFLGAKSWLNTSIFYILKKINYAYFLKILQPML